MLKQFEASTILPLIWALLMFKKISLLILNNFWFVKSYKNNCWYEYIFQYQGPKCGRGGRGQPPTTRLAESKVGFFGGWATKSWVFGLVFFLSWLCQRRTANDFRIGNKKLYFFLMNNPIATSFNKIYINVGSASHITVPKTQLSIVNGKKPNSV